MRRPRSAVGWRCSLLGKTVLTVVYSVPPISQRNTSTDARKAQNQVVSAIAPVLMPVDLHGPEVTQPPAPLTCFAPAMYSSNLLSVVPSQLSVINFLRKSQHHGVCFSLSSSGSVKDAHSASVEHLVAVSTAC